VSRIQEEEDENELGVCMDVRLALKATPIASRVCGASSVSVPHIRKFASCSAASRQSACVLLARPCLGRCEVEGMKTGGHDNSCEGES
jgi:hypothetical protein